MIIFKESNIELNIDVKTINNSGGLLMQIIPIRFELILFPFRSDKIMELMYRIETVYNSEEKRDVAMRSISALFKEASISPECISAPEVSYIIPDKCITISFVNASSGTKHTLRLCKNEWESACVAILELATE
jgi:hypothetical protein